MTEILHQIDAAMGTVPDEPFEYTLVTPALDLELTPGRRAKEKREILDRLVDYRKKHGLGCFNHLAHIAKGGVTAGDMRNMIEGDPPLPLSKWLAVQDALDKEEEDNGKV